MANQWDEANKDSSQSVTNSGLTLIQSTEPGGYVTCISTEAITTKAYFEIHVEALADLSTPAAHSMSIGLCVVDYPNNKHLGALTETTYRSWAYSEQGQEQIAGQGNVGTGFTDYGTGDIIGVAYDSPSKECWFSVNGVWIQGDPGAGTSPTFEDHHATYGLQSNAYVGVTTRHPVTTITANFGAIPFVYSIPTGFSAPESAPAITESDYVAWLKSADKRRCILVEAEYWDGDSVETRYLSNLAYISKPTDTLANRAYDDAVLSVPEIVSRIDGATTVGQIVIDNSDGERDSWIDDGWHGREIRIYLGDLAWSRDDFQLIITGVSAGIEAPTSKTLAFRLRDKMELLRVPVQDTLLANGDPVPLAYGTVANVTPQLLDEPTHQYQIHEAALNSLVDVRDSGVTVGWSEPSPPDGTFTLTSAPSGQVTAEAIGPGDATAPAIIEALALRVLDAADIDSDNLDDFVSAALVGIYIDQHALIADVIQEVANTVGAFVRWTRAGKLQLVRLEAPGAATFALGEDDIEEDGVTIQAVEIPRALVRMGYAKNFTRQDPGVIAGSVAEDIRESYAKEYSIVSVTDASVKTAYPLAEEDDLIGTLFLSEYSCLAEANRRLALRNTKRIVYNVNAFASPFQIQLGDTVQVTYPRYGLDSGVNMRVIGMQEHPDRDRVGLTLWA